MLTLKSKIKKLVRFAETALPAPVFNALWNFALPKYKATVRALYRVKGFLCYRFSDPASWKMVREIHSILPYSLVGTGGLEATYRLCSEMDARSIPGDFIELGVARGGCAALMAGVMLKGGGNGRRLWLFDSYEGLPDPTAEDYGPGKSSGTGDHVTPLVRGSCLGTLDEVQHLLVSKKGYPRDRIEFIKGWFHDTVPVHRDRIKGIAVLRIDGDWYESTKTCLEGLYDLVAPEGAVIIDDYQSCFGCKRAVDEFIAARGLNVDIVLDGRGGCYFRKPRHG
jgi:hypothetical protein